MWQYAQLIVAHDSGLATDGDEWTITCYGPESNTESKTRSYGDVLVELNRAGRDGWELVNVATLDARDGGRFADQRDWSSLTRYTFRRPHHAPAVERIKLNEQEEGPESEAIRTGRPAYPRDNLAESGIAEAPALVRLTLYWVQDSEAAGAAAGSDESGPLTGRFCIAREVARPYSQDEIYKIESLRVEYQDPGVSETRREQIKAAAGDYAASWVQGQWSVTWWETPQNFPLSQAADLLNGSAEWLRGLVEHPLADMASRTGAGGPIASIGAGVTANFVTARLTAPLESGARLCEIAGIVLGVMTGAHPLVMACAKRLVDDELSDMLAKGFEQIINAIGTDRGQAVDKRSSLEATGPTDSNIARSERLRRAQERAGIIDIQSGEGVGPAGGPVASRSAKKSQSPYGGIDAV